MSPNIHQLRAEIETVIDVLIGLLDQIDGDENLEPYLADTDPAMGDREFDNGAEDDLPGKIMGGQGA